MKRILTCGGTVIGLVAAIHGQTPSTMPVAAQRALVDQYCVSCHNDQRKAGEFSWTTIDLAHIDRNAAEAEKVVLKLRAGLMPPAGARRPDAATLGALTSALETPIDASGELIDGTRVDSPASLRQALVAHADLFIRTFTRNLLMYGNVIPAAPGRGGKKPLSAMGGMTPLLYAARQGHMDAVSALVYAGARVNAAGGDRTSPLVIAVSNGHFDVGTFLLDHGADPNLADESGLTPLYAAVDAEWAPLGWAPNPITTQERITYLDLMKALLDRGANPNARLTKKLWFRSLTHDQHWIDTAGATAFWRAAQASDVAAMRLLVRGGADPNIASEQGTTPLMVAAGVGWGANFHRNAPDSWLAAVTYCLEPGADVNATDVNTFTAIHGAAYRGDNEMVKLLVEKGARLDVSSKFGLPTDMANGPKVNAHLPIENPETLALLLSLGAPPPERPKAGAPKPAPANNR